MLTQSTGAEHGRYRARPRGRVQPLALSTSGGTKACQQAPRAASNRSRIGFTSAHGGAVAHQPLVFEIVALRLVRRMSLAEAARGLASPGSIRADVEERGPHQWGQPYEHAYSLRIDLRHEPDLGTLFVQV